MTVSLAPLAKQQFFDTAGNPLSGGKLFTYAAGTTTKQASYTDAGGLTANTNPVILNSRGEANVRLDTTLSYKFVLSPSTDTDPPTAPIWTVDNVSGSGGSVSAGQTYVTPEQFGALGDPTRSYAINDQAAIQAAVTYAIANGIREVVFTQPHYCSWATVRTSDPAYDQEFADGHHLNIPLEANITLRSAHPAKTQISYRSNTGASNATNWQSVASASLGSNQIWRGAAIHMFTRRTGGGGSGGQPTYPWQRTGLRLENMVLDGGTTPTSNHAIPASVSTGDGWDTSHKCIGTQSGYSGQRVEVIRCVLRGWRGENIYVSGDDVVAPDVMVTDPANLGVLCIRDTLIEDGNGSAINPNGVFRVDIDGLLVRNVYLASEGQSGRYGRMTNSRFVHCDHGGLWGGKLPNSTESAFLQQPTRYNDGDEPAFYMNNVAFEYVPTGPFIGAFTKGRIYTTDTTLHFTANANLGELVHGIDLDVIATADKSNTTTALSFEGHATAATKQIHDINIRLHTLRTDYAVTNGNYIAKPAVWSGSIGDRIFVSGSGVVGAGPVASGSTSDSKPCFRKCDFYSPSDTYQSQDFNASSVITPQGTRIGVYTTGAAGNHYMTLTTAGYQDGHEFEVKNVAGASDFLVFNYSGSGIQLPTTVVIPSGKKMRLKYSEYSSQWVPVELPAPLSATVNIDVASIAAGAVSAQQSITLNGAQAGMKASVVLAYAAMPAGLEITGVSATTNTVYFYVRNLTAGAIDPAALDWKATAQFEGTL